jgi:hypothetical protein
MTGEKPGIHGQHYTVRKDRGMWAVTLVTPCPGAPLRTAIAWHSSLEMALEYGREVAAQNFRPFKPGRTAR